MVRLSPHFYLGVWLISLAVVVSTSTMAQTKWMRAGSIYYTFDVRNEATPAEKARRDKYFYDYKCKVTGLYGSKEVFFQQAISHIDAVLNHPHFNPLMFRKKGWVGTKDETGRILYLLCKQKDRVIVNIFGRDEEHPCKTTKASGHTNAFASPPGLDERIIFLFDHYLDEQRFAPEPSKGVRTLARTVIHESLHTLGYSHFDPRTNQTYPVGSQLYNNTVPVYVGCLVMNWSNDAQEQERIRRNCELPSEDQTPSRYEWRCPGVESFRKGETVRFKLNEGWIYGIIQTRYKDGTVDLQTNKNYFEDVSVCRLQKLNK